MTPSELRVRRVSHRGHVVEWVLNPLWVQLDQKIHAEFGIERLYLVSRGRRVSIGNFLGADEKASFAKALLAALQTAKRGITYMLDYPMTGLGIGNFGRAEGTISARAKDWSTGDPGWYEWVSAHVYRFGLERPAGQVLAEVLGRTPTAGALLAEIARARA